MLSRVADNLYWFSRYVRRAENTARLVGVGSQLQLDMPRSVRFAWRPMINTVGAGDCFEQCYPDAGDAAGHELRCRRDQHLPVRGLVGTQPRRAAASGGRDDEAVLGLQRGADTLLQIEQVGFDGLGPVVHEITLATGSGAQA